MFVIFVKYHCTARSGLVLVLTFAKFHRNNQSIKFLVIHIFHLQNYRNQSLIRRVFINLMNSVRLCLTVLLVGFISIVMVESALGTGTRWERGRIRRVLDSTVALIRVKSFIVKYVVNFLGMVNLIPGCPKNCKTTCKKYNIIVFLIKGEREMYQHF